MTDELSALSLVLRGDAERALATAATLGDDGVRLAIVAIAQHALGRQAEFEAALAELQRLTRPGLLAFVCARTGNPDAAFDLMLNPEAPPPPAPVFELELAPLRQHERWPALAAKVGLRPDVPAGIRLEVTLPE